jgi:hypothetical protein
VKATTARLARLLAGSDASGLKHCKGLCGRDLPRTPTHFYPNATSCDGLEGTCKECRRDRNRRHGETWRAKQRALRAGLPPPPPKAHRARPSLNDLPEGRCQVKGCAHDAGENGRFCSIPHRPRLVGVSVVFAEARACYPTGEA